MESPVTTGNGARGTLASTDVFDVLVIGGGISALTLASSLIESDPGLRIMLVEKSDRLGGKIRTEEFCGKRVDVGPEGFVARTDGVVTLCRQVGLEEQLIAPVGEAPTIVLHGREHPIPPGIMGGVVTRPWVAARSGLLSWPGVVRAAWDMVIPSRPLHEDVSVGGLVARRMGREVADAIIQPLIGGIYAGDIYRLSAAVCAPQLGMAMASGKGLVRGARAASGKGSRFLTLNGGMGTLVDRLAHRLSGIDFHFGAPVQSVARTGETWTVQAGPLSVQTRTVVVCTPPSEAATLLRKAAPASSACLEQIDSVPVGIILLAYDRTDFARIPASSGFVVAPSNGTLLTACTWVSAKWPHMGGDGPFIVRCSVGRDKDRRALSMDDAVLVDSVDAEVRKIAGIRMPHAESRLIRWNSGMLQFRPGHRTLVDSARSMLPTGIVLLGEGYDGVGIASCVDRSASLARELLSSAGALAR